jgi:hypothetical protein
LHTLGYNKTGMDSFALTIALVTYAGVAIGGIPGLAKVGIPVTLASLLITLLWIKVLY